LLEGEESMLGIDSDEVDRRAAQRLYCYAAAEYRPPP
jgi:hypothetical protein